MDRSPAPRRRLWPALFVALLLAACGRGAEPAPEAVAAVSPASTAVQTAAAPTAVPPTPTRAPAVLRVGAQPIAQIDPALISSDSEVLVANHVYDYLVDIDTRGAIQPRLAVDWRVSDDGLVFTFQLAEGVRWHAGAPLTAADVVWTFNRLRDPAAGWPTGDLYDNIESVAATGPLEVTFTLAAPDPFFLFDLTDNHALIIPDGASVVDDFNGTGPFRVSDYRPGDSLSLAANLDYFVADLPRLDGIDIRFFAEETAAVDALRAGEVDLVMAMSIALFETLLDTPGLRTVAIPTNNFDVIRLRTDRPPGDDPRVIRALRLATDRGALFLAALNGYGAVGNDNPIGPIYNRYHADDLPTPRRDVAAARALLAEAGYADGLQLVLNVPNTGSRPDLAAALQGQWAEAGIDVTIALQPEQAYYGEEGWLEVDLGITGWGSRPNPQFYLDVMLTCGARWNESQFCDEELDALAAAARRTLDEGERVQLYHEIQRLLVARGPLIIPYYFAQLAAINDDFAGFELKAFAGRTDLRAVSYVGR